jgi:hypothetical protein
MALEVGLDLAEALRLAAEIILGMDIAVEIIIWKGSSCTPNLFA